MEPNTEQQNVIDTTEGILVVDAGAGTGKTATITRRYSHLLQKVRPSDIVLLTFTNNAAEHMKERIIEENPEIPVRELFDAPISTFHAFCNRLLRQYGLDAPKHLGLDVQITRNIRLLENEVLELNLFERFYTQQILGLRSGEMLSLIKSLCSNGIFPFKDGWFAKEKLIGDSESLMKHLRQLNAPKEGKNGRPINSKLLNIFGTKFRNKWYREIPSSIDYERCVADEIVQQAVDENREELFTKLHTVYREYIGYLIGLNRINFDFLIMCTFLMLFKDKSLRAKVSFEYVMVDEFQDTNELQFMLVLLLMKKENLCVVGDWKQGIYGFRNASIENILRFDERLAALSKLVGMEIETTPTHLEFKRNYRSGQEILDFSEQTLVAKAAKDDEVDGSIKDAIVSLKAADERIATISCLRCEDKEHEIECILDLCKEKILSGYDCSDIAVLARNRNFGLDLQRRAQELGIPVHFEAGIEIFRSPPAILLLAWLRLIVHDSRGWTTVLAHEGYTFEEIQKMKDSKSYPEHLWNRRKTSQTNPLAPSSILSLSTMIFQTIIP